MLVCRGVESFIQPNYPKNPSSGPSSSERSDRGSGSCQRPKPTAGRCLRSLPSPPIHRPVCSLRRELQRPSESSAPRRDQRRHPGRKDQTKTRRGHQLEGLGGKEPVSPCPQESHPHVWFRNDCGASVKSWGSGGLGERMGTETPGTTLEEPGVQSIQMYSG